MSLSEQNLLLILESGEHTRKVTEWLSPLAGEFERKQNELLRLEGRQDGIGQWFFGTAEFHAWTVESGKLMWCPGIRITIFPIS